MPRALSARLRIRVPARRAHRKGRRGAPLAGAGPFRVIGDATLFIRWTAPHSRPGGCPRRAVVATPLRDRRMTFRETEAFWDAQLCVEAVLPDLAAWEERHNEMSRLAARLGEPRRLATGDDPMQGVWKSDTGRDTHGLIFVHGGDWRRYQAANFAFVAEAAAIAGATFYNVDYRLMPGVRMTDVVADVCTAVAAAMGEVRRALLVGHCAGAHLALEAALRLDEEPAAVIALGGLYDLEPVQYSALQTNLGLREDEVLQFSPRLRAGAERCPVHLAAGAGETYEVRRQSVRMFEAIRAGGGEATLTFVPQRHRYSLVADLADPDSALTRLACEALA